MDTVLKDNLKHPYVIISGWNYLIISNVCSSVKTMNIFFTYLLMTPRNIKRGNSISFITDKISDSSSMVASRGAPKPFF